MFAGDPDRQREGSFADVERVVITSNEDDAERSRVTGYRGVRQLLRRAALRDAAIDRAVKELHVGHAVVLVATADIARSDAEAQLGDRAVEALRNVRAGPPDYGTGVKPTGSRTVGNLSTSLGPIEVA